MGWIKFPYFSLIDYNLIAIRQQIKNTENNNDQQLNRGEERKNEKKTIFESLDTSLRTVCRHQYRNV